MRRIFILIAYLLPIMIAPAGAQTIIPAHDTVWATATFAVVIMPDRISTSTGSTTVKWKVIDCNFPADWQPGLGICDNNLCYTNTSSTLWPNEGVHTSYPYTTTSGDFHAQIDLTSATTLGCYFAKVKLYNQTVISDSNSTETFVLCNVASSVPNVAGNETNVKLYPNPASDEINVVYDANADVRNIAVYNIIGKLMMVYKVSGNSANLNLENVPAGIYFVRLVNSNGQVVTTRKFTKQ